MQRKVLLRRSKLHIIVADNLSLGSGSCECSTLGLLVCHPSSRRFLPQIQVSISELLKQMSALPAGPSALHTRLDSNNLDLNKGASPAMNSRANDWPECACAPHGFNCIHQGQLISLAQKAN